MKVWREVIHEVSDRLIWRHVCGIMLLVFSGVMLIAFSVVLGKAVVRDI